MSAERPSWAPEGVDMAVPSPARMYDALLGGFHNFEVDRMAAQMAARMVPDLPNVALSNRAFLRRSVRFMVASGVRQFLDIGSGIPTVGNAHEIAQEADPSCRVAYVDIDPVAVAHSQAILGEDERVVAIEGDIRSPETLLAEPALRKMIDFDEPVGLLLIAVLHLLSDEDRPGEVVNTLCRALPPGSYVALSHLSSEYRPEDAARLGEPETNQSGVAIHFRNADEVSGFLDGLSLVPPGLVELPQWRPESADDLHEPPGRSLGLAGVGRKD